MQYASFPGSEKPVSLVGFGAWGIGGETPGTTSYGAMDEDAAIQLVVAARTAGITLFDTSNVYGYGRSERLLGQALRDSRSNIFIASKAGFPSYEEAPDYNPDSIEQSLEGSLERLQTDHLDLLQLHNASLADFEQWPDLWTRLESMRQDGRIRAIGLSVKAPVDAIQLLDKTAPDAFQANLNMLDLRAKDCGLLDRCQQDNIALLARTPMCFGYLSLEIDENSQFAASDIRNSLPEKRRHHWASAARESHRRAEQFDLPDQRRQTAANRAIRFCLSVPGVTAVLCGPMTIEELEENCLAGSQGPLPQAATSAIIDYCQELEHGGSGQ